MDVYRYLSDNFLLELISSVNLLFSFISVLARVREAMHVQQFVS